MTNDEIAILRQKAHEWQTQVAEAPAFLQTLYETIVDVCLQMTMQGADVPAGDVAKT